MSNTLDIRLFRTFKNYFDNYLPNVRAKSENTVISYRFGINLFNTFLQERYNKELCEICCGDYTADNILAFLDWLETARGNSPASVNQRLFELRSFCKYLMKNDTMQLGTLAAIMNIEKRVVPPKTNFVYLSLEQLEVLFEQPDTTTKAGIRDRFFLELMYESGCRDREILNLRVKDFVINKNCVSIHVIGKGNKYRATPITEKILPIFDQYSKKYLVDADPNSWMFYTVRNGIQTQMSDDNVARFMKKYEQMVRNIDPEFPHLHPHLLRRSRAMNLYIHGMALPIISEWLGHSQLETTTIYAQATTEMKRIAAEKVEVNNPTIFKDDVFKYANEEDRIKRLFGLR